MTDHHHHGHDHHAHHHKASVRAIAASPTLSLLRLSALNRLLFALAISALLWIAVIVTVN